MRPTQAGLPVKPCWKTLPRSLVEEVPERLMGIKVGVVWVGQRCACPRAAVVDAPPDGRRRAGRHRGGESFIGCKGRLGGQRAERLASPPSHARQLRQPRHEPRARGKARLRGRGRRVVRNLQVPLGHSAAAGARETSRGADSVEKVGCKAAVSGGRAPSSRARPRRSFSAPGRQSGSVGAACCPAAFAGTGDRPGLAPGVLEPCSYMEARSRPPRLRRSSSTG